MTNVDELLAQLKDVHTPTPPDAAGSWAWWLALCLTILILALIITWIKRGKKADSHAPSYLQEQCQLASEEPVEQGRLRLARLLRQQVTQLKQPAALPLKQLYGDPWLKQLNIALQTDWFTEGRGRQFGDNLYQSSHEKLTKEDCEHVHHLLNNSTQV